MLSYFMRGVSVGLLLIGALHYLHDYYVAAIALAMAAGIVNIMTILGIFK